MSFLKITNKTVVTGYELSLAGLKHKIVMPYAKLNNYYLKYVEYDGAPAELYHKVYRDKKVGVNHYATLLYREAIQYCDTSKIYGPAILSVRREKWHCIRVCDAETSVCSKIEHLTLGEHAVVPTSGRDTHQDVIARSFSDIAALKMALSA
jgi:hypothetical protein